MAAKDKIHDAVKNALIRDGWKITADPYTLKSGRENVHIDLAAEKLLAAERDGEKIAVEIKSFISRSPMHDLEGALGQYNLYASILRRLEPTRRLFLAVSDTVYDALLSMDSFALVVDDYHISIFVVELEREEIIQWIP